MKDMSMFELEPLVTIVIPVFNGEKYLASSIKSVLNQSYNNIELIIVNDGSTDGSEKIIKNCNCKYFFQKNNGQSSALNLGWKNASGSILGYLSCDDILESNCVEKILKEFNDEYSIIYPNYKLIDHNGEFINNIDLGKFSKKLLCEDLICFPGPGAFFKKEVFISLNGWDEELTQVPDFDFWIRASNAYEFKKIDKYLAFFRVHEKSGSFKPININKSEEILIVVKKFFLENNSYNYKKAIVNAYLISIYHHLKSKRVFRSFKLLFLSFFNSPLQSLYIILKILINKFLKRF
jgi:glycosyltransferase involved in cell wall biosynthesis